MATPTKPDFIDIRASSSASVSRPLRSPRLHVAGEHPPELSPLDAFALQSRLLAKQLEESSKAGKRMSRLPPLTTESPLIVQGRSDYFRSMSQEESPQEKQQSHSAGAGQKPEVEDMPERPVSMHPRMSRIPPTPDTSFPMPTPNSFEQLRGRQLGSIDESNGYFGVGARREQSPSSLDHTTSADAKTADATPVVQQQNYPNNFPSLPGQAVSTSPPKVTKKNSLDSLAPPRSMFPKRSSSIMSQPVETVDDEAVGASFHSQPAPRKLSSTSNLFSPTFQGQRSPSVSSNMSDLPRPAFNFSRPISRAGSHAGSRAGTPAPEVAPSHLETPARQASSDSHGSFYLADDSTNTPVSMHSDVFPDPAAEDMPPAVPAYTHSKFTLPRGKTLQRSTSTEQEGPQVPFGGQAPPSPPTRPSSAGSRPVEEPSRPSVEKSKLSQEMLRHEPQPSPGSSRPSTGGGRASEDVQRGRALTSSPAHDAFAARPATAATTTDSASTIRPPPTARSVATTMNDIPAEEHVTKAIALHEEGKLNESTYHLRHAAKQGHPTGMLLYALACRHGWGMRPNQKEGVQWLRKAAECAGVEIAEDEDNVKEGKPVDVVERRTRKAQLALSIYELGVSHMNGWGIEQDKALALRCFEIAGSWGDVDALAEAGFCYAQGVGCKKNLKKSAKFYRMAEAKGMNMVGNSWIHKAKYDDDGEAESKTTTRPRSKSRSRHFLGRKNKANGA